MDVRDSSLGTYNLDLLASGSLTCSLAGVAGQGLCSIPCEYTAHVRAIADRAVGRDKLDTCRDGNGVGSQSQMRHSCI
jgi:hypothetical protein